MRLLYRDGNSSVVTEVYTVKKSRYIGRASTIDVTTHSGTFRLTGDNDRLDRLVRDLFHDGIADATGLTDRKL